MDNQDTFSCFIIGTGSLPLQCGQLLVERGHQIRGVISSDVESEAVGNVTRHSPL